MPNDVVNWEKNGWIGYVTDYRGTPIGMLIIRARKDHRVIVTDKMTPEQVEAFDPDSYWLTILNREKA